MTNAESNETPHTKGVRLEIHESRPEHPEEMLQPLYRESDRPLARALIQPARRFAHTETSGGFVLLAAAILALILANSPLHEAYEHFIHMPILIGDPNGFHIELGFTHWINDLAMAVFFFVAGMEIKRELVHGDLRDPRRAMLPILAAVGGMAVPALIYYFFNMNNPETAHGWGIPMATDIAFAVGVLALVGKRAPAGLRTFLLTLAIVDDIGGILVIAFVYTSSLNLPALGLAALIIVVILGAKQAKIQWFPLYFILAACLWVAVFESGVHATIAGVILGLLTPAWPFQPPEAVTGVISQRLKSLLSRAPNGQADEEEQTELYDIHELSLHGVSPLHRLENVLHGWSAFVVLPLFALVNAGIELSGDALGRIFHDSVGIGIFLGLVLGKPLGVMLFSFIATKFLGASLPRGCGWLEMSGVGLLAGVGFTVAIFIAGLGLENPADIDAAKLSILLASLTAGIIGYAFLVFRDGSHTYRRGAKSDNGDEPQLEGEAVVTHH
ncbi:Na+/H+ antiporter NhaA [Stomatohabitans albus]|uniref:Na+/H+ antiporter NhaA n=1 Tax=Stomatohabitans albus TaxID=3110766 RepID=UPI00300CCBC5